MLNPLRILTDPLMTMLHYWQALSSPAYHVYRFALLRPFSMPEVAGRPINKHLGDALYKLNHVLGNDRFSCGLFIGLCMGMLVATQFVLRLVGAAAIAIMLILLSGVLLPFVPWLWRVPVVLSAALPLSHEIQMRRWSILRSTLCSTRDLVDALHAAGTYRAGFVWSYVIIMRGVLASIVVLPSLVASLFMGEPLHDTLLLMAANLLSLVYVVAEPVLDVAVDGAVGVIGATFARSQLRAMLGGFGLRVGLWTVQMLSLLALLPLVYWAAGSASMEARDAAVNTTVILVFLGPGYSLLVGIPPAITIAMILGWGVARLLALHVLMRLAAWRAARIGDY
ncbi:MAG: hypothetical protein JXB47_18995 [Anaerolineae bacterium]|nr:hypothetical protein [Anaerolineae bacterium]